MILAAKKLRELDIPTLGICLGMQIMVIEYAREFWNMENANSTEFDKTTKYPIIDIINKDEVAKGGTMKVGSKITNIKENTKVFSIYNKNNKKSKDISIINERHRHRYEVNPKIIDITKDEFSGINEDNIVDLFESNNNKFYVGCQYHPEYKTKPNKPHPLFLSLMQSIIT